MVNFNFTINFLSEPIDPVHGTYLVQLKSGENAVSTKLIR